MKTILRLICCGILFFCSDIAGGGYYDYYYPWNYCYQSWSYSQYSIPYFALHPPVYYSYRIARTYGDSHFPYRPGMRPYLACSSTPSPKIIKNEYVLGAAPAPSEPLHQTHQPLRIKNPFVDQSEITDVSKDVKWETPDSRKPLVVYPMSFAGTRQNVE